MCDVVLLDLPGSRRSRVSEDFWWFRLLALLFFTRDLLEVLVLETHNLKLSWSYKFPKYFRLSSSIPTQPCLAKPPSWSLTVIL